MREILLSDKLTKQSFMLFAINAYTNTLCTNINEFQDDLSRIAFLLRTIRRYASGTGPFNDRLFMNHFTLLNNVFELTPLIRMILFKADRSHHKYLNTIFETLGIMPNEYLPEIDERDRVIVPELKTIIESL